MTYTENYALNQWAKTDRIQMSDFNADNQKLDAALAAKAEASALTALQTQIAACGNCRIVTGTYTGTGKYGSGNKNTLTFDGKPLLVLVSGNQQLYAVRSAAKAQTLFVGDSSMGWCNLEWSNTGLSWYNLNHTTSQCNENGVTYYYVALLLCE